MKGVVGNPGVIIPKIPKPKETKPNTIYKYFNIFYILYPTRDVQRNKKYLIILNLSNLQKLSLEYFHEKTNGCIFAAYFAK